MWALGVRSMRRRTRSGRDGLSLALGWHIWQGPSAGPDNCREIAPKAAQFFGNLPGQRDKRGVTVGRAELDSDRAERLAPDIVAHWTNLVHRCAPIVPRGRRPCAYGPWEGVLAEVSRRPPFVGAPAPGPLSLATRLMWSYGDLARPGWPPARSDFIAAALVFLEADVMLFGSGYTKRHLITRLRQPPLTPAHIARCDASLRRAVVEGTGLEEHRAYRKLAARMVCEGALPDLSDWLEAQAKGALLTWDRAGGEMIKALHGAQLTRQDRARLHQISFCAGARWGVVYPAMDCVMPARQTRGTLQGKRSFSAYLMLETIKARQKSQPAG